jgi:hypothetical protein
VIFGGLSGSAQANVANTAIMILSLSALNFLIPKTKLLVEDYWEIGRSPWNMRTAWRVATSLHGQ